MTELAYENAFVSSDYRCTTVVLYVLNQSAVYCSRQLLNLFANFQTVERPSSVSIRSLRYILTEHSLSQSKHFLYCKLCKIINRTFV